MEFTEEQLKMISNFGALSYPIVKMISIMHIENIEDFEEDFKNDNSQLKKNYENGKNYAQYIIDLKLFEMAQSGDIKAMDKLEVRKIKMENFK